MKCREKNPGNLDNGSFREWSISPLNEVPGKESRQFVWVCHANSPYVALNEVPGKESRQWADTTANAQTLATLNEVPGKESRQYQTVKEPRSSAKDPQ